MKKLLFGLAALPFLAGVASAAQPVQLSDAQMDRVTAGFAAAADASSFSLGRIVYAATATNADVRPIATLSGYEASLTLYASNAYSGAAATALSSIPPIYP